MLQLNLELDGLRPDQLEALSTFILTYRGAPPIKLGCPVVADLAEQNGELLKAHTHKHTEVKGVIEYPAIKSLEIVDDVLPFAVVPDKQYTPEEAFDNFSAALGVSPEQAFSTMTDAQAGGLIVDALIASNGATLTELSNVTELDSAGVAWDASLHSANKSKVANGTWRMKRGVTTPTVAPTVPTVPVTAVTPPTVPAGPTPMQQYVDCVRQINTAKVEGKITQEEVALICSAHGVANFALLAQQTHLVPTILGEINALIAGRA